MTGVLSLSQVFLVFGTGFLASLSPCVYPILPITLGFLGQQVGAERSEGAKARVMLYALGQTLTFVALGIAVVYAGETLGFSSQSRVLNLSLGVLLFVAGGFSIVGRLPAFFSRWNEAAQSISHRKLAGKTGAFLLGAGSALLASPCTSPILGGVLALIATSNTLWKGIVLMFAYSVGFSFLFLLLGLGASRLSRLPRSGRWLIYFHRLSSFVLLGGGFFYLARGLDLV